MRSTPSPPEGYTPRQAASWTSPPTRQPCRRVEPSGLIRLMTPGWSFTGGGVSPPSPRQLCEQTPARPPIARQSPAGPRRITTNCSRRPTAAPSQRPAKTDRSPVMFGPVLTRTAGAGPARTPFVAGRGGNRTPTPTEDVEGGSHKRSVQSTILLDPGAADEREHLHAGTLHGASKRYRQTYPEEHHCWWTFS